VVRHGSGEKRRLLEERSANLDLGGIPDWLVANAGGNGFYRVRYSPTLLQALGPRTMTELEPIERYGLIDDTWAAVLSGVTATTDFLEFAKQFSDETDLDVWTVLSGALGQLDRLLDGEARTKYQQVLRTLYGPALDRLGWEPQPGDASRDLELRGLLIRAMASTVKDETAQRRTRELHARYLEDPESVEPNVAAAAAASVASVGSSDDYGVFLQRSKNAATPQEERRYQSLLGTFPGAAEMDRTLAMTLNGDVRTQDAPYLVVYCLMNRDQGPKAWEFMKQHWDEMLKSFPDNSIVRMAGGVRSLNTPELASEVEKFFESHTVPTGELTMQQHLEKLRVNVALREREAKKLAESL
jgi:puromycin-sensitive aminopeptidase